MRRFLLTTALLLPLPAMAQDVALILGVERYEQLDRVNRADDVLGATRRLEALGFDVLTRANPRVAAAKDLAAAFQEGADGADRLVVAVTGHFVTDGARTWVLTAEAASPDLFSVDNAALSLDSVLSVLAQRPGKAVLLLGAADPDDLDMDDSALSAGIGALDVPQGVTVIRATPQVASNLLAGRLSEPEATLGQVLSRNTSLQIDGFLPADWVLMPSEVLVEPVTPRTGPSEDDLNAEARLWDQTTNTDTVAAYRNYVARYPFGRFVDDAESQIEAILAEPNRTARLAEEALSLNRAQRREVQAQLTLLNYNTRGVDGIFGPGSRGAITNWQQSNGFPQTSYLTREQINLLDAQASRRQAEIDADEARELARVQALDRTYWGETGGRGDEAGFRAYLARYPEGLFAGIAEDRLSEIEGNRRELTEEQDRAAWRAARNADTVQSMREYLAAYPDGLFAARAQAAIDEKIGSQVTNDQVARAQAEEQSLRLSGVRAQLLELRLRDLGHNPGRLDGVIDENTRRAIASYQTSQGLVATGYVDSSTAVGLLTGGSLRITVPGR